jgi:hypothetical protein
MMVDHAQQERVHAYVAEIVRTVTGVPFAECCTALTISVAAVIIAWAELDDRDKAKARNEMAQNFYNQLRMSLGREDIVEWIKAHTSYVAADTRKQ